MKDFDAVIVGAGLGGLSTAAGLSKAGRKVLLVERHNVPGGYASSFLRGRFEFDVSLHELSGVGAGDTKGPLWMLLNEYGVADKVEFIPIPELYRCVLPDVDVTVPANRNDFEKVLSDQFPSQAQGIKHFTTKVFDFAWEAIQADMLGRGLDNLDLSSLPNMKAHVGDTMADVCFPLIDDPKARAVISQMCHYIGQPPSKVGFLPYAMALMSYLTFGPVHVRGTSQALSQAFVEVIEDNGGDIWLNNGASRILVSDGRIRGIRTEDGTEIISPYVICNTNPMVTCQELIGPENIPAWYLRRLGAWTPGLSTFNLYLGLDCDNKDLGLTIHETFVGNDYDLDGQYHQSSQRLDSDIPGAAVTSYNAIDLNFSPPGTSVVAITMGAYCEPWLGLRADEYMNAKSRIAEKAIHIAEMVAPNLRDHIEVLEAATPLTNIRYAQNPGGSYAGFAESRMPSNVPQAPSRGPLEGLYFANAWVRIGGGFMPCMFAGHLAAQDVLCDMERGGPDSGLIDEMAARMEKQFKDAPQIGAHEDFMARKTLPLIHPGRLSLKVDRVITETSSAKTLRMIPVKGELPFFKAGQYVNLFITIRGVSTSRPYTISSPPGKPYLDITIRRKKHGFVSPYLMDQVKPGDILESTGPVGTFCYEPLVDTPHLVFLAGGSGITPFASIMRTLTAMDPSVQIHLLYGSRIPEDVIFKDELASLASEHPKIKMDIIISEPPQGWDGYKGFLDKENIGSLVGSVRGKTFFICGPAQMHTLCEKALIDLGVPGRRIKIEACGAPEDISLTSGWPGIALETEFDVVEERSGIKFKARAGEPLMNSLERAGLVVPALCRSGECAACRTKLVSGGVYTPDYVHRRWADEKAGFIHPCMSYPVKDLRIRL